MKIKKKYCFKKVKKEVENNDKKGRIKKIKKTRKKTKRLKTKQRKKELKARGKTSICLFI